MNRWWRQLASVGFSHWQEMYRLRAKSKEIACLRPSKRVGFPFALRMQKGRQEAFLLVCLIYQATLGLADEQSTSLRQLLAAFFQANRFSDAITQVIQLCTANDR